jgi:hypothetical protein
MEVTNLLPVFALLAVALTVVLTEMVKKLDAKDRLKGYRVYVPLVVSCGLAWLLRVGEFFPAPQVWFWWAAIFAVSVFFFEAILKKIGSALGN